MGAIEVGGMSQKRLRAGVALLALAAAASVAPGTTAPAQEAAPPRPSLNLYGVTGLIDMPSAEAQPDAQVSASYSQFGNTAAAQLHLPGPAAGVGDAALFDDQRLRARPDDPDYDLFDRSLDLQFQLLKEKGWQPSVALGFRDVLGTGVYSAEYLVATQDRGAGLHAHRRHRLGAARQRRRGREPVLLDRPTASAPARTTSARAASRPSTRCSTARRWASSAASSGGRRSTS